MKNCGKCGAANNDQADFCSLCMTSFPKTEGAVDPPNSIGTPKPAPINVYEEMQAGVTLEESRTAAPGGPGAQGPSRPGVPTTIASISDAIRERTTALKSAVELFNDTLFFWWDHAFSFIAIALALLVIRISLWGYFFSRFVGSVATLEPSLSETSLITLILSWLLRAVVAEGLMYVLGYATLSIVTVKHAQGYGASTLVALVAGLISLRHTLWIMILQGLVIMLAPLMGAILVSLTVGTSFLTSVLTNTATIIIATASTAFFTTAIFVVLDQDIYGFRAFSVARELIGSRLPGVIWRLIAFGLMMSALVLLTMFSPFGAFLSITFVPAATVIYAWMVYKNLKDITEATETKGHRLQREAAQAAPTPV